MNIEYLQKSIPAEISSEISDQIQFFLRSYYDQLMRCVIFFSDLLIDLTEVNGDPEPEINEFLTSEIQPFRFLIVRAKVFRSGNKDVLCINMNHTPTDGAGLNLFFKKFLYYD
jgi:NRPS condensation-like uncharacterized protein